MGNMKSTSHTLNISSPKKRQSPESTSSDHVKLPLEIHQSKPNELSERDIAFLCSQTGCTSDEIISWHKRLFHENPDGRLDRNGFRKFYPLLRNEPAERLEDMSDHIFRAFDIDGNGYVEFGEFLLGFAVCSRGDLRARLDYAFECYDLDSNGYLTEDEIELVLRAMYNLLGIKHIKDYPSEQVAKDIMKKLDTSNDGRISRDEFIDVLMKDVIYRNMINPFH